MDGRQNPPWRGGLGISSTPNNGGVNHDLLRQRRAHLGHFASVSGTIIETVTFAL